MALQCTISRDEAWELLKKYNQDRFHLQHGLTVEGVMRSYAKELGHGDDADFWGMVGLLHDIDFEMYPEEHCIKAPELLRQAGVGEDFTHGEDALSAETGYNNFFFHCYTFLRSPNG